MFSEGMTSGSRSTGLDDRKRQSRKRATSIAALGFASSVVLGSASASGCSAGQFVLRERAASRALAAAEQTDARRLARYELVQARLYLAKAHEAAGEAHYQLALDWAGRSTESSVRARTLAIARTGARGASEE